MDLAREEVWISSKIVHGFSSGRRRRAFGTRLHVFHHAVRRRNATLLYIKVSHYKTYNTIYTSRWDFFSPESERRENLKLKRERGMSSSSLLT